MSMVWGCAWADEPPAPVPPPLFESASRNDRIGRILVPIIVNGKGPFQFVLDTGANRTVLTPRLVATLGLEISPSRKVTLSGVTGSASVPTVSVATVKAGEVVLSDQHLPVVEPLSPDVHGILGVDALANTRIRMDFLTGKLQIRKAHRERLPDDLFRIPAQCRLKRLVMVKATVGRIPVSAVLDTGSQYTLGNTALRAKLGLPKREAASKMTEVIGETLARQPGERRVVPVIRMGELQSVSPTVIFGDFHVFRLWNLEAEPAIVVGMDMIGSLETLVIDYQRCGIQARTRRDSF
jgi:predicted aspartyl protease